MPHLQPGGGKNCEAAAGRFMSAQFPLKRSVVPRPPAGGGKERRERGSLLWYVLCSGKIPMQSSRVLIDSSELPNVGQERSTFYGPAQSALNVVTTTLHAPLKINDSFCRLQMSTATTAKQARGTALTEKGVRGMNRVQQPLSLLITAVT